MKDKRLEGSGPRVLAAFAHVSDPARVDRYIDKIRESLKQANARFIQFKATCLLLLLAYHLFAFGGSTEISFLGVRITNTDLITKWFLVLPSTAYCLSTCYGYLRVYQQETIEWMLAKFYPEEYESGIYRLTFPSSYILGLDMMNREGSILTRLIAWVPTGLFVIGGVYLPPIYTYVAYKQSFRSIGSDPQLIASAIISGLLFVASYLIIRRSQKI